MKKILTILLLAISMVGTFSSCQKECTCEPKEQSLILGKWNLESTTAPFYHFVSLDFLTGGIVKVVYSDNEYPNGCYVTYNISGDILVIAHPDRRVFAIKELDDKQLHLQEEFITDRDIYGNTTIEIIDYKYTKE